MFDKIVNEAKQLTIITITGKTDVSELMSALNSFWDNPTKHIIWNSQSDPLGNISPDDIRNLCKHAKLRAIDGNRSNGKTALVGSNDLAFGLSRMAETYSEIEEFPIQVSVFPSLEEALNWIEEG
jgi:hypothetical protein